MHPSILVIASAAAMLVTAGCASRVVQLGLHPAATTAGLNVEGSGCGLMLCGYIPIKHNDRAERAYRQAISKVGADGLMDTTLVDRWYFVDVGGLYCTDLRGTGFRAAESTESPS